MNDLIQTLCDEIFLVEGGVDDFDSLSADELRVIIYHMLPSTLVSLVVTRAIEMQDITNLNREGKEAL